MGIVCRASSVEIPFRFSSQSTRSPFLDWFSLHIDKLVKMRFHSVLILELLANTASAQAIIQHRDVSNEVEDIDLVSSQS